MQIRIVFHGVGIYRLVLYIRSPFFLWCKALIAAIHIEFVCKIIYKHLVHLFSLCQFVLRLARWNNRTGLRPLYEIWFRMLWSFGTELILFHVRRTIILITLPRCQQIIHVHDVFVIVVVPKFHLSVPVVFIILAVHVRQHLLQIVVWHVFQAC